MTAILQAVIHGTEAGLNLRAARLAEAARDRQPGMPEPLVTRLLDELDYAVLLLRGSELVYANHAGRAELREGGSVAVVDGQLQARHAADEPGLAAALGAAQRGLRRLVTLGHRADGPRRAVALVPMGEGEAGRPPLVTALFARRRLCEPISVQCFAQAYGLTPAESRVLELLCDGLDPRDIARNNGVGMATVRTQVHSIRDKTGTSSIRALIHFVATLPPMVSSLRC